MKLSIIGTGAMGRGIAINLMKSGAELTVYARRSAVLQEFAQRGARTVTALAEAAVADIVCLCLPDSQTVEQIVTGPSGLLETMGEGQIIVDFSTISRAATLRVAEACRAKGVAMLDAPVSGMEARALNGTLTIMCGGGEETFRQVKPYLDCCGTKVLYMGEQGCGQLTKTINNILYDINCAAIAEILPMAVKLGLDPETIGEVVNSGTGRSYASEYFVPRALDGVFNDAYPMASAYKDLIHAAEIGAEQGIPLPVLSAATATYQTALRKGLGNESKGAMIKVYEDLLGVTFRR